MAETYTLDRIVDLLKVPGDRREACVREILMVLELAEFAEGSPAGPFVWTDDDKGEMSLVDPANNAAWLTLQVSKEDGNG